MNKKAKDISIKEMERLRKKQLMRAVVDIRRELFKRKVDMFGVKQEEAAKIYAKEIFGEEFVSFKEWVFSKIDGGHFKDCVLNEKTLKLPPKHRKIKVKIKKQTYDEFLKSTYWKKVRTAVLKRDLSACQICGSRDDLHIHHLTYKHHMQEMDNLDDLITLCKKCHNEIHGRINGVNTIPLGEQESIYDFAK